MKIAVCVSGQPRTWESCYPRWIEILASQGEVDFFFHLWDYNTLPNLLSTVGDGMKLEDELLSDDEKTRLIETFKPKKYIFESRKDIQYWNCNIPVKHQFGAWTKEQFYSLYYCSLLKRQWELENDFRYDVVIRLRADLWFLDDFKLNDPVPRTLYTSHNGWDEKHGCYRVGDIFYYADSHTFDQVSEFFKFLSYTPTTYIVSPDQCPPPEVAMYFYMVNIGILNHPTNISMKVKRDQRVLQYKGELDEYEII
jgi:hypothetical protein